MRGWGSLPSETPLCSTSTCSETLLPMLTVHLQCLSEESDCRQVWVRAVRSSVTESILKPCFTEDLIQAPLGETPASTCKAVLCQCWTSSYSLIISLRSDGGHKARGRGGFSRTSLFLVTCEHLGVCFADKLEPPQPFVLSLWEKSETALRKMI